MQILPVRASNLSQYLLPSPKSRSKRVHRIHKPPYPELHQRRPPTRRGRSGSPATASGGVPPPPPNAPRGPATDAWAQPVALSPPTPQAHTHTCSPVPPPSPRGRAAATSQPTAHRSSFSVGLFNFRTNRVPTVCLSPRPRLRLRVRRGAPPATSQSCRADKPSLPESENRISEIPLRHPPSALGSPIRTLLPSLPPRISPPHRVHRLPEPDSATRFVIRAWFRQFLRA